MAIYKNADLYITDAYLKLGTFGSAIMDNYDGGFGNSAKQDQLWRQIIKLTKLLRTILNYTNYDSSGNWLGTYRVDDETYNQLLFQLIKVGDLLPNPLAPKLLFRGNPSIAGGGSCDCVAEIIQVQVDSSGANWTLDASNAKKIIFVTNTTVALDTTINPLVNDSNALEMDIIFNIVGGFYNITFPSKFVMSDPRWEVIGAKKWTPNDQGKYKAHAVYNSVDNIWEMDIDGPYK